jgi:uncharacterized repeat protein (TIGR03837 family)
MPAPTAPTPLRRWDLFCRVVDNYGDAGVCWRLAADLATRGESVRLWIDDASPLAWMAPAGCTGVEVRAWRPTGSLAGVEPGDVVIEAFGCDPPADFVAAMADRAAAGRPAPLWINLEYLSAEDYVERSHALRSPQMSGPGRGLLKWFFYPGFTDATGGLLRDPGLVAAQAAFDRAGWLRDHAIALDAGERLASVFCYPGADLRAFVEGLARGGERWRVVTAPGAATALAQALPALPATVRIAALPWLAQDDYDRLLWAADLNLVRGEDSFVRAQWAGRPFLWQIYEQDDGVHAAKLEAFLGRLRAGSGLSGTEPAWQAWNAWQQAWNGFGREKAGGGLPAWTPALLGEIESAAARWRAHLLAGADLVTRLLAFVDQKG